MQALHKHGTEGLSASRLQHHLRYADCLDKVACNCASMQLPGPDVACMSCREVSLAQRVAQQFVTDKGLIRQFCKSQAALPG